MRYSQVHELIAEICSDEATNFKEKIDLLFDQLNAMDRTAIIAHVEFGGVIPESYSHDSSEEKLFAKYCDFLLAKGLELLGMKSEVIGERADAADVLACMTVTHSHVLGSGLELSVFDFEFHILNDLTHRCVM
jgi:HindIII restriction endonuclease